MSDLETYLAKAAESLAAAEAATSTKDRAFHLRANGVWRKLVTGVGEAEQRAASRVEAKPKPAKASAAKSVFPASRT